MSGLIGKLRVAALGLAEKEVRFDFRGFHYRDPTLRAHLENAGLSFVSGFNLALENSEAQALASRLEEVVAHELRGFAYEGASMALYLLDLMTPWSAKRFARFVEGPANHHAYMAHVGAGWAMARLARRLDIHLKRMDPVLGWLTVDGFGFHEGFFHPQTYYGHRILPKRLTGYALRAFDQGLGRAMWFARGADVPLIMETLRNFAPGRHADLWGGLGLACTYAGGLDRKAVENLREIAGPYRFELAQGATFAAKARLRAGNVVAHNELACQLLCGMDVASAAAVSDKAYRDLYPNNGEPAYETWRQRIRAFFEDPR